MTKYRAVFISDCHLGQRGVDSRPLLRFLESIECDYLYLVGDVIDGWARRTGWKWTSEASSVVARIAQMSNRGTVLLYSSGNHDEFLLPFLGDYLGVSVWEDFVHETSIGDRYLVLHGHQLDRVMIEAKWLARVGDVAYYAALWANRWFNLASSMFGVRPLHLSAWLKARVKLVVNFVSKYEEHVVEIAKERGVDGVVCGHIHTPNDRRISGVHYLNCGDWVETHSAVVEDLLGEMRVLVLGS